MPVQGQHLIGILGFLGGSHPRTGGLLERIGGYSLITWVASIGITLVARRNVAATASTNDDGRSQLEKTQVTK